MSHDYLDAALKPGQTGVHLVHILVIVLTILFLTQIFAIEDIYPKPYKTFSAIRDEYSGLYFENPLPEELEYCPGGSQHHI